MYVVRKAPGTSTVTTSLPLNASMVDVISTASRETVGDVASDFKDPYRCLLPSTQARPLAEPSLFLLKISVIPVHLTFVFFFVW
jgi:hypothetical protein